MTRSLLFALLSTASLLSVGVAHAKGDKAVGKTLVYTCAGCHGVPGYENAYPNYRVPRIVGQNEQYLITALHEYKTGLRKHPTMDTQAQSLSDKDIQDIAAYLSSIQKK